MLNAPSINTLAHFWTVKAFLPAMLRRGGDGHIVTLASVAGLIGSARLTDYSASKFAAVGFHEALQPSYGRWAEPRNMSEPSVPGTSPPSSLMASGSLLYRH